MATSGDRYLATSGDLPMARDNATLACPVLRIHPDERNPLPGMPMAAHPQLAIAVYPSQVKAAHPFS